MIDRSTCLSTLRAALAAGRADFARDAAAEWLAAWPGDPEAQLELARAEIELGHLELASGRLAHMIVTDAEFAEAYPLLAAVLHSRHDAERAALFAACGVALAGAPSAGGHVPDWVSEIAAARQALASNEPLPAVQHALKALQADPDMPLPSQVAARAHLAAGQRPAALAVAAAGLKRWSECVALRLIAATAAIEAGDVARGIEALHRASSDDPTGRVAEQILGKNHPFRGLWPTAMTGQWTRPIPAEVSALLGANLLSRAQPEVTEPSAAQVVTTAAAIVGAKMPPPVAVVSGSQASPARAAVPVVHLAIDSKVDRAAEAEAFPKPETWESFQGPNPGDGAESQVDELAEVRAEFDRLAAQVNRRRPGKDEDKRTPAYVIVSSKTRLIQEFGADRFRRIDEAIAKLMQAVRARRGWRAYALYTDEPTSLRPFGLTPAEPGNAWQIKLRLADMDRILSKRREMIGALLIVGGPRIVPFHLLPNPTDDDDQTVPSDNPYSTTDENYFVPEWPVGRVPSDNDADLIVRVLQNAATHHLQLAEQDSPLQSFRAWMTSRLDWLVGSRPRNFGYSANIWRKASLSVFRAIGDPGALYTSPPAEVGKLPAQVLRPARLSYFNLHGVEDSPEWFGQRDPLKDSEQIPEFPVALRPQDVVNSGRAPKVVYSEACYGANVLEKSAETALALKFLASGTHAVVGSTKISYGSVTPPLIAADLLGRMFWEHLRQNLPAGEALRRAKLGLAAEMLRRQGVLDGEDQKTLISFVLFGDPLYSPAQSAAKSATRHVVRKTTRPARMSTACALGDPAKSTDDLDPVTHAKIKAVVSQYLPGMVDASSRVHQQRTACVASDHQCPSHQFAAHAAPKPGPETTVVTLSKAVDQGNIRHNRYARLTLDHDGRILKLAVSR
jgi:tetratricopeptide (TPR) repeat protein